MINDFVKIINASSEQTIVLSVDGGNSKITDSSDIENSLINYGIDLCNSGEYKTLSEWIRQLPVSAKENGKLALVVSYYMTHAGNYLNALSWLPKGKKSIGFDNNELFLVDYLNLTIQRALGLISYDGYCTQLKELSEKTPDNLLNLQAALNYYKYRLAANRVLDDSLIENFNKTIDKIKSMSNLNSFILVETEFVEFSVEGILIFQELARNNFELVAHNKSNYDIPKDEAKKKYDTINDRLEKWGKRFSDVISDKTIPLVTCARYALEFATTYSSLLEATKVLKEDVKLTAEDKKGLNERIGNLEWAINVFDNNGLLHESLKAKLVEADVHKKLGNTELHNEILQYVIEKANEIGLSDMAKPAEDILMNRDILDDVCYASPEEHRIYALQYMQAFNLPEDRFDNVYKEYWWIEQDCKERSGWCEYIETIQDLTHTLAETALYAYDPERLVRCSKFNYESIVPGHERELLIVEFKSTFCSACKERKPKMSAPLEVLSVI
jgi:hypothetical protein